MSNSTKSYLPSLCKNFAHPRCHAAETLWLVFSPILLTVGTIGNILSICVLLRKRMHQSSASIYLISLACADIGVLYIGLLKDWFVHLTETDAWKENDVTCKLHFWLQFVSMNTSAWILTAFTVDRQISIVWPIFARTRCSKRIPYVVVTVIPLLLMAIGSHYFFMKRQAVYQWSNTTNSPYIYTVKCEPESGWHVNFYYQVWSIMLILITSICPAVIIFISNIRILKVILSRNKRIAPRTEMNTDACKKQTEVNRSMNSMLIAVSVFYILSTLPACVHVLLGSSIYRQNTTENIAIKKLLWTITSLFYYSNSAFNFLLYCFSGSMFRLLLKEMISSLLQSLVRKVTRDRALSGNVVSATGIRKNRRLSSKPAISARHQSNILE